MAYNRCPSSTSKTKIKDADHKIIKKHICTARKNGYDKAEVRFLCRYHKCLKKVLQHKRQHSDKKDSRIGYAVLNH